MFKNLLEHTIIGISIVCVSILVVISYPFLWFFGLFLKKEEIPYEKLGCKDINDKEAKKLAEKKWKQVLKDEAVRYAVCEDARKLAIWLAIGKLNK